MSHRSAGGPVPAWAPSSPCEVDCLDVTEGRVPAPVAVARLLGVVVALLGALLLAIVYPLLGRRGRAAVVRGWFRTLLWSLSIRVSGAVPADAPGGSLVVANHVSWVDILVLGVVRPGRIVAKADVRAWPLIGTLAARGGTIFLDRTRLSLLPDAVADVRDALRSGARVLAFPEGSTWCGAEGGRFRPALFQAAIDAHVPIEPLTIRYRAAGQTSTAAAFVGEDPLVASLWRVARARGLAADVRCHQALTPTADRRDLAAEAGRLVHGVPAMVPARTVPAPAFQPLGAVV